jgi:hypothetical protein
MLVASTSVGGFNYNLPPPTLGEGRHRGPEGSQPVAVRAEQWLNGGGWIVSSVV